MNFLPRTTVDGKLEADELWYKHAIIYQLHVKAFADSDDHFRGAIDTVKGATDEVTGFLRLFRTKIARPEYLQ